MKSDVIETCMDNAEKIHLIINEIKKYAIKARDVKTNKAYENNIQKFHEYCEKLTAVMGKNYVYCYVSSNSKSYTGKYVPYRIGFKEHDDNGNFIRFLDCEIKIYENY